MCKKQNLWPLRLRLEAAIWGQSAPVLSINGFLCCPRGNATTQLLICVYNRFFGEQNRVFLAADNAQTQADTLEFWGEFEKERAKNALGRAPLPVMWALVARGPKNGVKRPGGLENEK